MAANITSWPESPYSTFMAGTYEMSRLQARQCAVLHQGGATLWQIKEEHHPQATLKEIVVAIQVGAMWAYSFADMVPDIFDPRLVCLEVWGSGNQPPQKKKNKNKYE